LGTACTTSGKGLVVVIIATKKATLSTSKKGIKVTPKKKGGKKK
jgi:hypothetical protein